MFIEEAIYFGGFASRGWLLDRRWLKGQCHELDIF
jgi:hypothetical protein